jgi:hypothetical protein
MWRDLPDPISKLPISDFAFITAIFRCLLFFYEMRGSGGLDVASSVSQSIVMIVSQRGGSPDRPQEL